jgi:hypothetical protein
MPGVGIEIHPAEITGGGTQAIGDLYMTLS